MNVSEFTRTVKEMRDAQKSYFKDRLRSDLIRSKELEAKVDKALKDGLDEPTLVTTVIAEEERQMRLRLDQDEPDFYLQG